MYYDCDKLTGKSSYSIFRPTCLLRKLIIQPGEKILVSDWSRDESDDIDVDDNASDCTIVPDDETYFAVNG